jgi:putative membrane protein
MIGYLLAVILSNRQYKTWPISRIFCWVFGVLCIWFAMVGPIANQSDFTIHMISHLLLGMLAPLLMVLAAPMTLILRTCKTSHARLISRFLRNSPIRILTHPIVTSLFYIGGLGLLYMTELYILMHQYFLVHLVVHCHLFLAGYFFTASILYIDPISHRFSFIYRSIVCLLTLAGHAVLSKYIYAHPPIGVPLDQAKIGGMMMYYGGDIIDAVLIYFLLFHWFRAARSSRPIHLSPTR